MKTLAIVLLAVLLAVCAFGADVDGKWVGAVSTPNGDFPQTFTLKAEGAGLSGSLTGPDGMAIPLKDGKVDGANISFSVTLDFGGMMFTLNYKGVVENDHINLKGDFMGMPFELVVKKSS